MRAVILTAKNSPTILCNLIVPAQRPCSTMAQESILSVVDCLMPWVYVSQLLYFPTCDSLSPQVLRDGLSLTLKAAPCLAQNVYRKGQPKGHFALMGPPASIDELFRWQATDQIDYVNLKANNFPFPTSDATFLKPSETRQPLPYPAPVFRALLTMVKGGSILCVAIHHATTDITGLGSILKMWATNCRAGSLESIGLNPKWLDRTAFRLSATPVNEMPHSLHIRTPEDKARSGRPIATAAFDMRMFRFPETVLRKLRAEVSQDLQSHGVEWLSTNDVLTALLWSAVVKAETDAKPTDGVKATFNVGIPVNCRRILRPPLPDGYVGPAIVKTVVTLDRETFLEAAHTGSPRALTPIAAAVRRAILQVDSTYMRSALSFLESQDDLTNIQLGPPNDGDSIVSWAAEGVYELDWGDKIGRCESVRIQKLNGRRYPIIFPWLPTKPDVEGGGGLEVLISLEKTAMDRLQNGRLMKENAVVSC